MIWCCHRHQSHHCKVTAVLAEVACLDLSACLPPRRFLRMKIDGVRHEPFFCNDGGLTPKVIGIPGTSGTYGCNCQRCSIHTTWDLQIPCIIMSQYMSTIHDIVLLTGPSCIEHRRQLLHATKKVEVSSLVGDKGQADGHTAWDAAHAQAAQGVAEAAGGPHYVFTSRAGQEMAVR